MQGPGAEYLVILSDRQLWEAQLREHSRMARRPRARRFTWPGLTWLRNVISGGVTRLEAASPSATGHVVPRGQQALFGSSD
jgi:hypothetical protein